MKNLLNQPNFLKGESTIPETDSTTLARFTTSHPGNPPRLWLTSHWPTNLHLLPRKTTKQTPQPLFTHYRVFSWIPRLLCSLTQQHSSPQQLCPLSKQWPRGYATLWTLPFFYASRSSAYSLFKSVQGPYCFVPWKCMRLERNHGNWGLLVHAETHAAVAWQEAQISP